MASGTGGGYRRRWGGFGGARRDEHEHPHDHRHDGSGPGSDEHGGNDTRALHTLRPGSRDRSVRRGLRFSIRTGAHDHCVTAAPSIRNAETAACTSRPAPMVVGLPGMT